MLGAKVFFGGLGQVTGGFRFAPDFHGILNRHPFPDVLHGCLLEGMALALEGRFVPFSARSRHMAPCCHSKLAIFTCIRPPGGAVYGIRFQRSRKSSRTMMALLVILDIAVRAPKI